MPVARPASDTTNESYTTELGSATDLWDSINEDFYNDSDYIQSALTPTYDVYVTKLSSLSDPLSSSGHIVRFRYKKSASGGDSVDLVIQLRQGYTNEGSQGTLIATVANLSDIPSGWTPGSYNLSGVEADAITDYTNLYLRFVANRP